MTRFLNQNIEILIQIDYKDKVNQSNYRSLTAMHTTDSFIIGLQNVSVSRGDTINITITSRDTNGDLLKFDGVIFEMKISDSCLKSNIDNCTSEETEYHHSVSTENVMIDNNNRTYIMKI